MRQAGFEKLINDVSKLIPDDLRRSNDDLRRNLKAAVTAGLARMDLVTREEFDIQCSVLNKTRVLLEELEQKVAELERQLEQRSVIEK